MRLMSVSVRSTVCHHSLSYSETDSLTSVRQTVIVYSETDSVDSLYDLTVCHTVRQSVTDSLTV